ncbi:MAG: oligosaccharide repeat unit polymerase, partial [Candidatus Hydrogenedentota bacterium]
LFWIVAIAATMSHPVPWYELITEPYWKRTIDATEQVPIFLLNSIGIVPVLLLGARLFDRKVPHFRIICVLFAFAILLQIFLGLTTGARGRLLNIFISLAFLRHHIGSRRVKKIRAVAVATGVLAFVFLFFPLRVYRDTGNLDTAMAAVGDGSWYKEWLDDPANEAIDFCMLSLDYYHDPNYWRGVDSITGILAWFVPRRFWPSKPVNFGNLMWSDIIGNWTPVGVGPTFLGEFYACAGAPGILLISFFLGAAFAFCQWFLMRHTAYLDYQALTACLLYASIIVVRGDFTSTFGRTFMLILPSFLLFNWLAEVAVSMPTLFRTRHKQ